MSGFLDGIPLGSPDMSVLAAADVLRHVRWLVDAFSGAAKNSAVNPTGTILVTPGSKTVNGTGTNFTETAAPGYEFLVGDFVPPLLDIPDDLPLQVVRVDSVISDVELTITEDHVSGVLNAGVPMLRAPRIVRAPEVASPLRSVEMPHIAIGVGTINPETSAIGRTELDIGIVTRMAFEFSDEPAGPGEATPASLQRLVAAALAAQSTLCVPRFGEPLARSFKSHGYGEVDVERKIDGWITNPAVETTWEATSPATVEGYTTLWRT